MADQQERSPAEILSGLQAGQLTFRDVLRLKEHPPGRWSRGDWLTLGSGAAAAASPDDGTKGGWRRVAILGYEQTTESPASSLMERSAFHRLHLILERGPSPGDSFQDPTWFFRWLRDLTADQSPEEFARREVVSEHLVRLVHGAIDAIVMLAQHGVAIPEDVQRWIDAA